VQYFTFFPSTHHFLSWPTFHILMAWHYITTTGKLFLCGVMPEQRSKCPTEAEPRGSYFQNSAALRVLLSVKINAIFIYICFPVILENQAIFSLD
jgi:hypothetical protein